MIEHKFVLFFDICLSSKIVEYLEEAELIDKCELLLKEINYYLKNKSKEKVLNFYIYKFLGDGWILIFENKIDFKKILEFCKELCDNYSNYLKNLIINNLKNGAKENFEKKIKINGLTFGIDVGLIYKVEFIDWAVEYYGTTMNLAARLQSSISAQNKKEDNPSNQLLIRKEILKKCIKDFKDFKKELNNLNYKFKEVERTLKNLKNNDKFKCIRIWFNKNKDNKNLKNLKQWT